MVLIEIGTWRRNRLFRIYHDGEEPTDLLAQIQNWANRLGRGFMISDDRSGEYQTELIIPVNFKIETEKDRFWYEHHIKVNGFVYEIDTACY